GSAGGLAAHLYFNVSVGGVLRYSNNQFCFRSTFDRRFGAVEGDGVLFLVGIEVLAFNGDFSTHRPLLRADVADLHLWNGCLGDIKAGAFSGLIAHLYFYQSIGGALRHAYYKFGSRGAANGGFCTVKGDRVFGLGGTKVGSGNSDTGAGWSNFG